MKDQSLNIIGALFIHFIYVVSLGLIGFFVWNSGITAISHSLPTITYTTSTAIMLGVYIINMFCKLWITRVITYRQQKYFIDKIIKFYNDNGAN